MHTLVKILMSLGWGSGALFVSFLFGCIAGAVAWWRFHPRWPLEYNDLAKEIVGLSSELQRTDWAVDALWSTARFRQERIPSASAITSLASDPNLARVNQLIVEVIIVKKRLQSLLHDLEQVSPWLTASQTPQKQQKRGSTITKQGVVIERKGPEDPVSPDLPGWVDDPPNADFPISASATDNLFVAKDPDPGTSSSSKSYGTHRPSKVIDLYNRALTDPLASQEFREQYQPIRIGIVNAVERRLNPTAPIAPEFRQTTDGDFFAFPLAEPDRYGVVPRLGLTIGPVSYQAGALGEMFGNPSYDPTQSYSRYSVRQPALFRREGECWILEHAGQLTIGSPD